MSRALALIFGLATAVSAALCGAPAADAVWTAPADFRDRMDRAGNDEKALPRVMQEAGARPAAIAFAKQFGDEAGYLGERTEAGPVALGTLYFPLRASNVDEPCAIDADGRLVRFAGPDAVTVAELSGDRTYRKLAKRGTSLEGYPPLEPVRRVAAKQGGLDLVARFPLRTCPRCPARGTARVAYQFDAAGRYRGRRLLGVSR